MLLLVNLLNINQLSVLKSAKGLLTTVERMESTLKISVSCPAINKDHNGQRHDFGTYNQYSCRICSGLEADNDVISATFKRQVGRLSALKFRDIFKALLRREKWYFQRIFFVIT